MEQRQLAMRVEVDQARVDQELRKAARKAAAEYRIPGFRKGKAPYHLIVQYVGLPTLFNEFIEPLGQEIYPQAIEEAKIEPYAIAQLDIESLEPLTYTFIVPLEPEVNLGDYRSLRVDPPTLEVSDEEVETELQALRSGFSAYGEVDRPSEFGDLLTLDVKSVIIPDAGEAPAGEAPEGEAGEAATPESLVVLDETDWDVTPDAENPMDPPGFDEALLGMRPGDEKEFVLGWPADSRSIHAGKQATFHVKLHKIQANSEPALDDTFAQMVGPDFPTLDDLKANVRETLTEEKQGALEEEYIDLVMDALLAQSVLDYPPAVVEDQLDTMMTQMERQLREYGFPSMEQYLQQMGQTVEQYRDSIREQAELTAKRNLLISEIYRLEGIEATDEDIHARVDEIVGVEAMEGEEAAESAQAFRNMLLSGSGRAVLESQILQEKSVARILAIARGEEVPPPAPKPADDEPATGEAAAGEAVVSEEVVSEDAAPAADATATVDATATETAATDTAKPDEAAGA
jgi:trigger factor